MMRVLSVAALAHVQDLGRLGWRSLGIGGAGAMDALALQAGNLLLRNRADVPAIEIALGGMSVCFDEDTPFCLTGALYEAFLDEQPIYSYWRYTARKGQVLRLVRAVQGMYGYLCVQGGFDVPEVLGARATDVRIGMGGWQGRTLMQGDELPTAVALKQLSRIGIAPIALTNRIRAVASSEYAAFSPEAQQVFWREYWVLQSESNRMGYRLSGEALALNQPLEMLSHAVQAGTVQVPPSGQPIVLMADAQTTGGYPKMACVVAADLGRLAQVRFGSKVLFEQVSISEARRLRARNQAYLNQVSEAAKR